MTVEPPRTRAIHVDEHGMVRGSFPEDGPGEARPGETPLSVEVLYDGQHWATVPVLPAGLDGPHPAFSCRLPLVSGPATGSVTVLDGDRQTLLFSASNVTRQPLLNAEGISAHDVFATTLRPLFGVPWLAFDGAKLVISGSHLPPGGDPARLSIRMGAGVVFTVQYPLLAPEFGFHYWFWPNAHLSNFIITIDLAASDWGSDPFQFDFITEPVPDGSATPLRQRVHIPSNLNSFVGHPHDGSLLQRVQTWSTSQTVSFTGYNAFRALEALLARHGVHGRNKPAILDWGCGHGRVARHFLQQWPGARVTGADIDAENIAWCTAAMPGGTFLTLPLMPPTPLPANSFDAVFGVSVMTHLSEAAQQAWLMELARALKPGGIALLSFADASAAAWGTLWHSLDWWQAWRSTGFTDSVVDPALDGKIGDDTYYRQTMQSAEWTRERWSGVFDVVAIEPDLLGNQSVIVLRKPRPSRKRGSPG